MRDPSRAHATALGTSWGIYELLNRPQTSQPETILLVALLGIWPWARKGRPRRRGRVVVAMAISCHVLK